MKREITRVGSIKGEKFGFGWAVEIGSRGRLQLQTAEVTWADTEGS